MQNLELNQVYIGSNFDNLHFHAKSLIEKGRGDGGLAMGDGGLQKLVRGR